MAVALAGEVAGAASGRLTGPADGLHRGPEERQSFKGLPAGSECRACCPPSPPLPSLPTFRPPPPTQHKAKEDRSHRHCHRDEQHRCGRRTPCEWGVSRVPRCRGWGGRSSRHIVTKREGSEWPRIKWRSGRFTEMLKINRAKPVRIPSFRTLESSRGFAGTTRTQAPDKRP